MALAEINWKPDRRRLRVFGVSLGAVLATLGAIVLLRGSFFGIEVAAGTAAFAGDAFLVLAGISVLLAAAAPKALMPVYLGISLLTWPLGCVISLLVLALIFYCVLTPIGLILRLVRPDPLGRHFDPQARTYWTKRSHPSDIRRYFRQF